MAALDPRVDTFVEDLEQILLTRFHDADNDPRVPRTTKLSESDLLRQVRIRVARFRQGY